MLVLFLFYKPVCQVISAWQRGYLRSGWRPGSPCRSEFGNLIERWERTMWESSPYFLWWFYYKRNIVVVLELQYWVHYFFHEGKERIFVQIYLFHMNILRFKTSQYISGASTSIISEVCRKRISFSARNGKHWAQLIAKCQLPFCFLANNTLPKKMWKQWLWCLIEQPKSQNTSCVHIFVLVQMPTEENNQQTA